jgi:hypothetical protein
MNVRVTGIRNRIMYSNSTPGTVRQCKGWFCPFLFRYPPPGNLILGYRS